MKDMEGKKYPESEELPERFDYPSANRSGEEVGMVVAVRGDLAQVTMQRSRVCEGCGSCCVLVDEDTMLAEARNAVGAKQGDRVVVELPASASIRAAYILYGVPLLAFLVGLGVGALLGSALFGGGFNVPLGLIFGFAFLVISYILLSRIYAPGSRASSRYRPVVKRILTSKSEV
jgi:sigma-E factor negative regulatory protein RseC